MDAVAEILGPDRVLDGTYEVGRLIGRGGMASVYEGRAIETGRSVAIKVLRPLSEDPEETRRRFFQEIVAIASLRHPCIVSILDFGVSREGLRYLVMERLHGHTLAHELRRFGPLHPDRAVPRMLEVLDAIEVAHRRGLVHSDLKPSNLFLRHPTTEQEAMTVLDFGVAHRFRAPAVSRAGTPQYAPPELLLGQSTDPATDVYQLGLVLAETLSGRAVMKDVTTARQCLDKLNAGPLPLGRVEGAFREVVHTAIAPDPLERYRSIAELREALLFAWLQHKGGPRVAIIEGSVGEDAHTVPFEGGSLEAHVDDNPLPAAPAEPPGWVVWALLAVIFVVLSWLGGVLWVLA